ncbi:MAG TPA: hypothetical protein VLT92_15800 [Burkholderiales bacterium]|nr:hypothetical protein [Burkholderiales bacterium]
MRSPVASGWCAILAPANTPAAAVNRLNVGIARWGKVIRVGGIEVD